jgi:hypothetical protein
MEKRLGKPMPFVESQHQFRDVQLAANRFLHRSQVAGKLPKPFFRSIPLRASVTRPECF